MSHNNQKKIAVINDFSGFGRCSLAVSLPIISHMKVQCCPLPTSIFSNHTGFPSFYYEDFTSGMQPFIDEWKKLDLRFSAITTGFLGSSDQINIVKNFFQDFKKDSTLIIVDPVMGDYGKIYPTYTEEMCRKMKELALYADILTPNLTEACILTDTSYKAHFTRKEITGLAEKLSLLGPEKIVITGIPQKSFIANFCFEKNKEPVLIKSLRVGTQRSGTGDIFSSVIAADAVNGVPFETSVKKASRFIKKCIIKSIEMDIPLTDGVCFEEVLHSLK